MKIAALGEDALTRRIMRWCGTASRRTRGFARLSIGDDAALLAPAPGRLIAATTDTLVEGVHFRRAWLAPRELGARAMAQNLSDLAAMAAAPRAALLALSLPEDEDVEPLRDFFRGARAVGDRYGCAIVGGNLARAERWTVTVTALGEVAADRAALRSGARPGDELWVTGTLGDPAAWLAILLAGRKRTTAELPLRRKFALPAPRVREAALLAERGAIRAAIDVSDGLSTDLARLCAASGVGAAVEATLLPRSRTLARARGFTEEEKLRFALHGGEEFELLFAAPPGAVSARLRARLERATGTRVTRIGTCERRRGVRLIEENGRARPLAPEGWDHFRPPRGARRRPR